jgi:hypothetical protein
MLEEVHCYWEFVPILSHLWGRNQVFSRDGERCSLPGAGRDRGQDRGRDGGADGRAGGFADYL